MDQKQKNEIEIHAGLVARGGIHAGMKRTTHYLIECVRDGKTIWTEEFDNLVVTAGLTDSLDKHFKGSGYTAAWYVGLTGNTPNFVAGDSMASHGGWTEVTNYSFATRPQLQLGDVASGSVDNSSNKASYTISAGGADVGGAFVVNDSTKSGSTGVLYGGGAFSQNRALLQDDVLNVTVTLTAAAA
jgi:hypothetical protein